MPSIVLVCVLLRCQADVMPEPGANMSTHLPKFEKSERASVRVVAPTVIALGALAGDLPQASESSLPAATTMVMPARVAAATASFTA